MLICGKMSTFVGKIMHNNALTDRPMVLFALLFIVGISRPLPSSPAGEVVGLALLLMLMVLLRKHTKVATALACVSVVVLGMVAGNRPLPTSPAGEGMYDGMWSAFLPLRGELEGGFSSVGLSGDRLGVLSAMTLGEKGGVDPALMEDYRRSGAAHVFALSGLHVGILFGIVSMFLPSRLFPRLSAVVQVVLLWLFVMVVGPHASLMRAATMLTCYAVCRMLGRDRDALSILSFAAVLLLLIQPEWLFDVGFQLSFVAVLSILLFYSPLYRLFPAPLWDRERWWRYVPWQMVRYVWGIVVISFVATVATLPLSAYYFHRVPLLGMLSSLVVSPCAFVILFLAVVVLLTHSIMVGTLLGYVVDIMNGTLHWIGSMPYASLDDVHINLSQVLLLYTIVVAVMLLVTRPKNPSLSSRRS